MQQWKTRSSAQCPQCQEANKTKQQAVETQQQWETVLQGLDDWLQAQNTHPGQLATIVKQTTMMADRQHREH